MTLEDLGTVLDAMNDLPWRTDGCVVYDEDAVAFIADTAEDATGIAFLHNNRYALLHVLRAVSYLRGASEEWYAQVALSSREGKVARHLLTNAIDKCVSSLQELGLL